MYKELFYPKLETTFCLNKVLELLINLFTLACFIA